MALTFNPILHSFPLLRFQLNLEYDPIGTSYLSIYSLINIFSFWIFLREGMFPRFGEWPKHHNPLDSLEKRHFRFNFPQWSIRGLECQWAAVAWRRLASLAAACGDQLPRNGFNSASFESASVGTFESVSGCKMINDDGLCSQFKSMRLESTRLAPFSAR